VPRLYRPVSSVRRPDGTSFLDDHFHVVNVDVGNWDRNLDVSQRYGSPIDGGIPAS